MSVDSEIAGNHEGIYAWIDQISFSKPKRNFARDFSDGVFMAELLKRYYPRLVDIHNYIPGNSIAKKVDNWCTLNRKVLSKLDIKLGKDIIQQLANSQPGIVEKVLLDLRAKILKDCNNERNSLYSEFGEDGKGEMVTSVLDSEEIMNKTVPRQVFVRLKQELEEKNGVIENLHQKVLHLESLMKLKDQRITDLTTQITRPLESNGTPRSNMVCSGSARIKANRI